MIAENKSFAAWLGLTPRQNSSGGKQTLGGITKQGNRYISWNGSSGEIIGTCIADLLSD
jgi:transposase